MRGQKDGENVTEGNGKGGGEGRGRRLVCLVMWVKKRGGAMRLIYRGGGEVGATEGGL